MPVGHIFDVITNGYGSMPEHRQQIPPRDRWAIASYVRALQLSQHFPVEKLTDEMRAREEPNAMSIPPPARVRGTAGPAPAGYTRRRRRRPGPGGRRGGVRPPQFFRAYLAAYLFVLSLCLGSLALVMMYHLTGGAWGYVIRRNLEAAMRTLPLLAVLFVPLALGADATSTRGPTPPRSPTARASNTSNSI